MSNIMKFYYLHEAIVEANTTDTRIVVLLIGPVTRPDASRVVQSGVDTEKVYPHFVILRSDAVPLGDVERGRVKELVRKKFARVTCRGNFARLTLNLRFPQL